MGKSEPTSINTGLDVNGEVKYDKRIVANKLNYFYTSVATNLVEQIPPSKGGYRSEFVRKFYER